MEDDPGCRVILTGPFNNDKSLLALVSHAIAKGNQQNPNSLPAVEPWKANGLQKSIDQPRSLLLRTPQSRTASRHNGHP